MACLFAICPRPVQHYADRMAAIANSEDARWQVHNLAMGVIGLTRYLDPARLPVAAPGLTKLIGSCSILLASCEFFLLASYFLQEKEPMPRFVRGDDGTVRVVAQDYADCVAETGFNRDIRKNPVAALSNVAVVWACFSAVVGLLEQCKIDLIGPVAAKLGACGVFGKVTGEILKTGFAVSGGIAYTTWCFLMMCRQIHYVSQNYDKPDFNAKHEMIITAATATLFVLEYLKVTSGLGGLTVSVVGIISGSIGCYSFLIRNDRAQAADKEQMQLAKLAKQQLGMR